MVIAWVFFSSVGVLVARHCKSLVESETMCGVKYWFVVRIFWCVRFGMTFNRVKTQIVSIDYSSYDPCFNIFMFYVMLYVLYIIVYTIGQLL